MREGWVGGEYLIIFSDDERKDWEERYCISKRLPGFRLWGFYGWEDLVVISPKGDSLRLSAIPMKISNARHFEVPDVVELSSDPDMAGKVPWHIKPIALGGSPNAKENMTVVSLAEHATLVAWWNHHLDFANQPNASSDASVSAGTSEQSVDMHPGDIAFHRIGIWCCLGFMIGASAGAPFFWLGRLNQGLGISLIGGVFGVVLAWGKCVYGLNIYQTVANSLVSLVLAGIPGGSALLGGSLRSSSNTSQIENGTSDPLKLQQRLLIGAVLGTLFLVPPMALLMIYAPDQWFKVKRPEEVPLVRVTLALVVPIFAGSLLGAAIGGLTVSGVHRRNISLGAIIGAAIGAGVATSIAPNAAVSPFQLYAGSMSIFSWFGILCGLLAPENFGVNEEKESNSDKQFD